MKLVQCNFCFFYIFLDYTHFAVLLLQYGASLVNVLCLFYFLAKAEGVGYTGGERSGDMIYMTNREINAAMPEAVENATARCVVTSLMGKSRCFNMASSRQ